MRRPGVDPRPPPQMEAILEFRSVVSRTAPFHMTTRLTAELAREPGVGQLLSFHLSSRSTPDIWSDMLREAQAIFARTEFPSTWKLEKGG